MDSIPGQETKILHAHGTNKQTKLEIIIVTMRQLCSKDWAGSSNKGLHSVPDKKSVFSQCYLLPQLCFFQENTECIILDGIIPTIEIPYYSFPSIIFSLPPNSNYKLGCFILTSKNNLSIQMKWWILKAEESESVSCSAESNSLPFYGL